MRSRLLTSFLAASAALTLAASAFANGRFPAAGQLVINPKDPDHLVLRATYGVLETSDRGRSWSWMCEKAIGYGGVEDPAMGLMGDGTILAGIFAGLSVSHDRGCTWGFVEGPTAAQYTIDVSVERQDPSRAVAITSTGSSTGFHVVLAETSDNGKTWSQAGAPIASDFLAQTVDVAPSNPSRVYVSGLYGKQYEGAIERTDDRGATWTRLPLDLAGHGGDFIAAVDPNDADRLYLRLDGDPSDTLLMSTDGAVTWTTVFSTKNDMLGFALSPDGKTIALGGPKDGLYVASTSDMVFEKVSSVAVKCLAWAPTGLYACGDEFVDGFTIGVSTDQGKSFQSVYHLSDLSMLSCPADTPMATTCPSFWPAIAETIGASLSSSASSASAASATSTGSGSPNAAPPETGCGCQLVGGATGAGQVGLGVGLVGLLLGAIRRRRREHL